MVAPRAIDSTFSQWIHSSLETGQWRDLPYRLSLVSTTDGSWDDFVRLWPNRDLPAFVADALPSQNIDRYNIDQFTKAHHFAAMFGIVSDRISDRQCSDREVLVARKHLLHGWLQSLATALGDVVLAREIVGSALHAWKQGVDLERRLLGRPHSWNEYASAIMLRLRWVSITAASMLRVACADQAARALERCYDQFLLALQILDDHADRAEDEHYRGAMFAVSDLELGPRAISGLLMAQAARCARDGRLEQLAKWLSEFSVLMMQQPVKDC